MRSPTFLIVYVAVCSALSIMIIAAYLRYVLRVVESATFKWGGLKSIHTSCTEDRQAAHAQSENGQMTTIAAGMRARRRLRARVQSACLVFGAILFPWGLLPFIDMACGARFWPKALAGSAYIYANAIPPAILSGMLFIRPTDTKLLFYSSLLLNIATAGMASCILIGAIVRRVDPSWMYFYIAWMLICLLGALSISLITFRSPWIAKDMSTRRKLTWLRLIMRHVFGWYGVCIFIYVPIRVGTHDPGFIDDPDFVPMLVAAASSLIFTVACTRKVCRGILSFLAHLGSTSEEREAALMATMCAFKDSSSPAVLLCLANKNFRSIDFNVLSLSDIEVPMGGAPPPIGPSLSERSIGTELGCCDAFMSHSWRDDAKAKWTTLSSWSDTFVARKGRTPTLWLDKACLNQAAIAESLPCLPIYLAGCETLLMLPGPTYCSRLWCVMEVATFVAMQCSKERMQLIPLSIGVDEAAQAQSFATTVESLQGFDARTAQCFDPKDRQGLLSVIESSFGSFTTFNEIVHDMLFEASMVEGSPVWAYLKGKAVAAIMIQRYFRAITARRKLAQQSEGGAKTGKAVQVFAMSSATLGHAGTSTQTLRMAWDLSQFFPARSTSQRGTLRRLKSTRWKIPPPGHKTSEEQV